MSPHGSSNHLAVRDSLCPGERHHPVLEAGTRLRTHTHLPIPSGPLVTAELFWALLTPSPHPSCSRAGREGSRFLPLPSPDARAGQQLLGDQLGTKAKQSSPIPPYTLEGTRAWLVTARSKASQYNSNRKEGAGSEAPQYNSNRKGAGSEDPQSMG